MKKVKCRNEACLLNKNKVCINPCRNRENFTCSNENVKKPKPVKVDYRRSNYPQIVEHEEIEKYINERRK